MLHNHTKKALTGSQYVYYYPCHSLRYFNSYFLYLFLQSALLYSSKSKVLLFTEYPARLLILATIFMLAFSVSSFAIFVFSNFDPFPFSFPTIIFIA